MKKEFCEHCGAIMKTSKKGNQYCSKICWKDREEDPLDYEMQYGDDWGDR